MNCLEAKRISIIKYLNDLGYSYAYQKGDDYWYNSPFREEKTPSFKVSRSKNVFFEFHLGVGGTIIDLGMRLHECSIEEFLHMLSSKNYSPIHVKYQDVCNLPPSSKLLITDIRDLSNKNLINYLIERRISVHNAQYYCNEVETQLNNRKYYSIGFKNRSGGYELRNKYYKSSTSPKDISVIKGKSDLDLVVVFEGFMDFMSYLELPITIPKPNEYIVLNSLALLPKAIPILLKYHKVYVFFDRDEAGKSGFNILKRMLPQNEVLDMSETYSDHKDLNDFLIGKSQRL